MILIFNRVRFQLDPQEAGEKSTGIQHRSLVQGLEHYHCSLLPIQSSEAFREAQELAAKEESEKKEREAKEDSNKKK
jgi:hypothetical protein